MSAEGFTVRSMTVEHPSLGRKVAIIAFTLVPIGTAFDMYGSVQVSVRGAKSNQNLLELPQTPSLQPASSQTLPPSENTPQDALEVDHDNAQAGGEGRGEGEASDEASDEAEGAVPLTSDVPVVCPTLEADDGAQTPMPVALVQLQEQECVSVMVLPPEVLRPATRYQVFATHCSALQHTAAHCSTMQCAVQCSLQHTAAHLYNISQLRSFVYTSLQTVAMRNVDIRQGATAARCSTLSHTPPHSNTLKQTQCATMQVFDHGAAATQCNTLQHFVPHCNTLTATHSLQHTHCNTLTVRRCRCLTA